jgi:hypothetical protein
MANAVLTQLVAEQTLTITLASLGVAAARQSTMNSNSSKYPAALLYIQITSGTAPTAGGVYSVYLLRGDGASYRSDGAGATDAAITTLLNAMKIGSIKVTNSGNTPFYWEGDTTPAGPLGTEWGIAIKNDTDQIMHATPANHYAKWVYHYPEIQ